jgi:hypothetical protein
MCFCAAALAFLCLGRAALFGQQKPESLADLDTEINRLAVQVNQRLTALAAAGTITVRTEALDMQGEATPLGDYWALNLSGALSNIENRRYTFVGVNSPADYTLSGEITEIVNTVRVFTRLIRAADASITATWNSDFGKNDFLIELLERETGGAARRDRYENDSREAPVTVEISGNWLNRTIHNGDDRDWFLIVPNRSGLVVAETSGSMDTMMELYDGARGAQLQSNDDGGEGTNARIAFLAEPGKQYIAMIRGYNAETGAYRFHALFENIPDEANEPNDSRDRATAITIGTAVPAYLNSGRDTDWYRGEVPAGGRFLTVYTEGSTDTIMTLYDAQGNELASDDDSGDGGNARLSANLPAGPFFVKVEAYGGNDGGGGLYTLQTQIREAIRADEFELDNQRSQAKDITIGQRQRHNFTEGGDVDWVHLAITQAGRYGIRARGEVSTRLDTYIELYNSKEELISENDDGGDNYDAYLSTQLSPGDYYIKIRCLDREPEEYYLLTVERE